MYLYGIRFNATGNITFTLDDPPISTVYAGRTAGEYIYDVLFFRATGLDPSTEKTVRWSVTNVHGPTFKAQVGLFDYAIVEMDAVEGGKIIAEQSASTTSTYVALCLHPDGLPQLLVWGTCASLSPTHQRPMSFWK